MALVFPPSSPSVLTRSSSSSPSTIFSPHPSTRVPDNTKQFGQQRVGERRWNSPLSKPGSSVAVSAVGLAEPRVLDPPGADVADLKLKLLGAVSGLNRGLAADREDLERAESAAKELESAGGIVDLTCDLDKLQGRWKLVYSSAFSSRTLGGSRPGPPTGRLLPITLGKVFQRIDVLSNDFDNIVELEFGTPWPLPKAEATATLAHKFELTGSAKIKITFVNTTVKPTGSLSQIPPIDLPRLPDGLRPPSSGRGEGEFEVTYLDSDTRITRGDKGELRVFLIA